ncbi:hypothetical protein IY971_01655 [Campylobacter volucris]|uniref:hypothetical protein n=1 Tax=Campylobacter volucris TaxID=1031542 RepID=UPI0018A00480|nr:hypothetical protein [Campylobacter volucris]MBF7042127.1 hypothetical protein [Campylobacter volucris]MBF7066870.1 hypothetical protein [Campylobacter volucris]
MSGKNTEVKSCVVSLKELVQGEVSNKNKDIFLKDGFSLDIPYYQRPFLMIF